MYTMLSVIGQVLICFIQDIVSGFLGLLFWRKKELKNISGQLALVTGGARGLGKAIAEKLAQEGCNIAICDVNIEEAQRTSEEIRSKYSISCEAFKADVSDPQQVAALHNEITKNMGTVDILVNNAGILAPIGVLEGEDSDVTRVLNINLTSHFWMVRKFLPSMIEQKRGHILGICSAAGKSTIPLAGTYCASKFGVNGFYRTLFDDICVYEYDKFIKITCAFPGFINTRNDLEKLLDETNQFIPRVQPEYAAEKIVEAMLLEKHEILFPFSYKISVMLEYLLPTKTRVFLRTLVFKYGTGSLEDRISVTRK
ncbi:estradiol 17-beta-dehydrogenase 11-like [Chironomus tepperi]|uniref:estradiol 17-beta-dehydrogenase 11-like n=1 Tax=Chironomus tepperi TaxID=113505 RepID=UPI00391F2A26